MFNNNNNNNKFHKILIIKLLIFIVLLEMILRINKKFRLLMLIMEIKWIINYRICWYWSKNMKVHLIELRIIWINLLISIQITEWKIIS